MSDTYININIFFLWILHLILLLHLSRSALMIKGNNVFLQSFSHY